MSDLLRLFVACELPETITAGLAAYMAPLRALASGVRWVKAEKVHLTLKFLGETPAARVAAIKAALVEVCRQFAPFVCEIAGAGVFPNPQRPQVLWVGLNDPQGRLARLATEVDRALHGLGFAREKRPFAPHVTLGRVRDGRAAAVVQEMKRHPFPPHQLACREIVLMQSVLQRDGAVYTALQRFALGQGSHAGPA
ncbi:MAG: RNA 2',3'-cyclic phosphodiesterase [candidate division KSB1 bacterium]|nr:RNA 2',3'-cyclic phosphodiesterase [candidate division KSB1 bacterium]MDZ7275739.1 RNA 2',3'-cyclic phosphodiesterase [candidate division KSB1 bacterium]MDZ7284570.1 RNA 2',3'-cyclic phosphodiesterase [candidate division KSB1 bacterium]MDZ7298011.1 RNA 2',3'-cyclic phosphodiesterase [candidate division KSB1 bacterium]MDZ7348876.1 RNA 2',3'-cyclic phosphodiesterase [candidate division KSB1 bacterium]